MPGVQPSGDVADFLRRRHFALPAAPTIVQADAVVVRDRAGRVRIMLGVDLDGYPAIMLLDEHGREI
jgi:hypothetical protein